MMTYELNLDAIKEELIRILSEECSEEFVIQLNNESDYYNEVVYNDEIGLTTLVGDDKTPYDIACKVFYGDYRPNDEYVKLDGYGNFQSFDASEIDDQIDLDTIATDIIEGNINYEDYEGYSGWGEIDDLMERVKKAEDFEEWLNSDDMITIDDLINIHNHKIDWDKLDTDKFHTMKDFKGSNDEKTKENILKLYNGKAEFEDEFDYDCEYFIMENGEIIPLWDDDVINRMDFDELNEHFYTQYRDYGNMIELENYTEFDVDYIMEYVM